MHIQAAPARRAPITAPRRARRGDVDAIPAPGIPSDARACLEFTRRLDAAAETERTDLFDEMLERTHALYGRADFLRRGEAPPVDYLGARDRLACLARAVPCLLPHMRSSRALRVDRACTALLTPPLPRSYDPRARFWREGPGERAVRDAVARVYRAILASPERVPLTSRSFADMLRYGRDLSPSVRAGFLADLAKAARAELDPGVRYASLLDIVLEAQRLPLRAALALKANVMPLMHAIEEERRCVNPSLEEEIFTRMTLGESLESTVNLTQIVEHLQTPSIDPAVVAELAARARPSHSPVAHATDLRTLRVSLTFAAQAPLVARKPLLDHLLRLAHRCNYELSFAEHENALAAYPKVDAAMLETLEQAAVAREIITARTA